MGNHEDDLWDWDSLLLQANPLGELGSAPEDAAPPQQRRRRDPRLTCPNYLAGRVPCACSDEDGEQEEERQRKRTSRVENVGARCQVPSCASLLTGLKGYHQRHRVCLTCANATAVFVDDVEQRYCQQCGKFHLLSNFDEGKRSCRRKLEKHNSNRRRRVKGPAVHSGAAEPSTQSSEKDAPNASDGSNGGARSSGQPPGEGTSLVADEDQSLLGLLVADQVDRLNPKPSEAPKKLSTYTSPYPTRRISFKFYDWNPADFPRRLRHQILEWLGNMPVELEGYIRSGCTILTLYIAMPDSVWAELVEHWDGYLDKLIKGSESGFWDKGLLAAYFDDKMSYAEDGAISSWLPRSKGNPRPVLEGSFPICVEPSAQAKVTVFGQNLVQQNSRLLVGFQGQYLPSFVLEKTAPSSCQINILTPMATGVAFIEVGYEHGISNFLPVLIADKQVCEEVRTLEAEFTFPCCGLERKQQLHDLLLDLGWLLSRGQRVDQTRLKRLLAFSQDRGWHQVTSRIHKAQQPTRFQSHKPEEEEERDSGISSTGYHQFLAVGAGGALLARSGNKLMVKITIWLLVACAAVCVLLQHPKHVVNLSISLRRCLWTRAAAWRRV